MFTPRFQIHVAPRIHHFVSRALVLDILLEEEVIEERKSGKRRKEEMEKKGYILSPYISYHALLAYDFDCRLVFSRRRHHHAFYRARNELSPSRREKRRRQNDCRSE